MPEIIEISKEEFALIAERSELMLASHVVLEQVRKFEQAVREMPTREGREALVRSVMRQVIADGTLPVTTSVQAPTFVGAHTGWTQAIGLPGQIPTGHSGFVSISASVTDSDIRQALFTLEPIRAGSPLRPIWGSEADTLKDGLLVTLSQALLFKLPPSIRVGNEMTAPPFGIERFLAQKAIDALFARILSARNEAATNVEQLIEEETPGFSELMRLTQRSLRLIHEIAGGIWLDPVIQLLHGDALQEGVSRLSGQTLPITPPRMFTSAMPQVQEMRAITAAMEQIHARIYQIGVLPVERRIYQKIQEAQAEARRAKKRMAVVTWAVAIVTSMIPGLNWIGKTVETLLTTVLETAKTFANYLFTKKIPMFAVDVDTSGAVGPPRQALPDELPQAIIEKRQELTRQGVDPLLLPPMPKAPVPPMRAGLGIGMGSIMLGVVGFVLATLFTGTRRR